MERQPLTETDIPELGEPHRGKVRDVYDLPDRKKLFVQTDRISAFDYKLKPGIPDKGRLLTALSEFWFEELTKRVPGLKHHLITTDVSEFGHGLETHRDQLEGRSMIGQSYKVAGIEAIVRGYLSGSGSKEYKKKGSIGGIALPGGLVESQQLPEPIFTPSTKAENDENISFAEACGYLGKQLNSMERARKIMGNIRDLSLATYSAAAKLALEAGIIIADTKFEWGIEEGTDEIVLVDEVLTPDSSRFWPLDTYEAGRAQESFDKQFVRDWLENESGWKKGKEAPPPLPADIVAKTRDKYVEAYERLTGQKFAA